ncbi:MAG: hypothetical protein JWQ99_199 [Blastococcus sp.]|jgi:hypothetical protein|nr:hypothetical protein [Blastococcus sp.]
MSPPIATPTFSVRPGALEALAAELAALAGDLSEDGALCRSAATSLATALGGDEGWSARAAATAWAALAEVVAARAGAVAGTLVAAVAAYRSVDQALAEQIGPAPDAPRGHR